MKSRIPSIIAILILVIALAISLFIIREAQIFTSSAKASLAPQDLKITNIRDTSFSVSWITSSPTIGFIEYTSPQGNTQKTTITSNSLTHFINITNLNPSNSYSFKVNSNGSFFQNGDSSWTVSTQSSLLDNQGTIISGNVLDKSGFPSKNTLIYVDTGNGTFSTVVSLSGSWVLKLPPLEDTAILQILVEDGDSMSLAKVDVKNANPVPTITLGNSYDFRNSNTQSTSPEIPKVDLELP